MHEITNAKIDQCCFLIFTTHRYPQPQDNHTYQV